jgi:hypothetical protein
MTDIPPDKLEAALDQLEGERERRLQAKIDSGELVVRTVRVVVFRDEDAEAATERALAEHPVTEGIHNELLYIFSGLPRCEEYWKESWKESPQIQPASSNGPLSAPSEEPAAGMPPISCPRPTYVRVILRNGEDGDPGQIAEAYYTIEDGLLVLRDSNDKHITSRALLNGEDPAVLARSLLREREAPKDFQRPLHYPKMGLA